MSTTTTPATTQPATVPASQVIPFPLPWSQVPGCAPGCVPPGGMDALMKCYMDIKAAMQFISKVMIDLINNDPAVAQAIIAAIEKSGSSLPTIGVTNAVAAQPGQVGEWQQFVATIPYSSTASDTTISVGVLPPGDWDVFAFSTYDTGDILHSAINQNLTGIGGWSNPLLSSYWSDSGDEESLVLISNTVQALTATPTPLLIEIRNQSLASSGNMHLTVTARRAR